MIQNNPRALLVFLACTSTLCAQSRPKVVNARLENGLQVIQRPIKGAKLTCIVVVFRLGEEQDPPGHSGFAHLVEHLYATAPAAQSPARGIDQIARRYGDGWNFQTGDDYTIAAVVVPNDKVEAELREAASRMASLRPTPHDLARELPRISDEVRNMFERMPALAAANLAREAVLPSRHGGRKGGLPEHLRKLSLEAIQERFDRYYKPGNAILALAGGMDAEETAPTIQEAFGKIPAGQPPEPAPHREPPKLPVVLTETIKATANGPELRLCLAFAAPSPADEDYPAFLLQLARLTRNSPRFGLQLPVQYRPLDDPWCVIFNIELRPTQDPRMVLEQVDEAIKSLAESPLDAAERTFAQRQFGFLLGTVEQADSLLAGNPYGVAFSLARRAQLGVNPTSLADAIKEVDEEDLKRVADTWMNANRRAAVILRSE